MEGLLPKGSDVGDDVRHLPIVGSRPAGTWNRQRGQAPRAIFRIPR
jgi:hypothetical protein